MTVVTPLETMSSTRISGARVAGPPSPPPPRMWTWGSMSPGRTRLPAGVDDLGLEALDADAARIGHGLDDAAGEQDVLPAERLGGEDVSVADQSDHGRLLDRVTGLTLARLSGRSQAAAARAAAPLLNFRAGIW